MPQFDFERLHVWQKSIEFVDHALTIVESLNSDRKHYRLMEQFESACASIPQNIAEGKGRSSNKEYLRFLHFARGSVYEVITLLVIFKNRNWIAEEQYQFLRVEITGIVKMLNALITSVKNRV